MISFQNKNDRQILDMLTDRLTWNSPEWKSDWTKITALSTHIPFLGNPATTAKFKNRFMLASRLSILPIVCLLPILGRFINWKGPLAKWLINGQQNISTILLRSIAAVLLVGLFILGSGFAFGMVISFISSAADSIKRMKATYARWRALRAFGQYASQINTLKEAARLLRYDPPKKMDKKLIVKLAKILGSASDLILKLKEDKKFHGDHNYLKDFDKQSLQKYFPDLVAALQENIEEIPAHRHSKLFNETDEQTNGLMSIYEKVFLGVEALRKLPPLNFVGAQILASDPERALHPLSSVLNSKDLFPLIGRNLDSRGLASLAHTCRALYQRVRENPSFNALYLTAGYDVYFPRNLSQFTHIPSRSYSLYIPEEKKSDFSASRVASGPNWLMLHAHGTTYWINNVPYQMNLRENYHFLTLDSEEKCTVESYELGTQQWDLDFFLALSPDSSDGNADQMYQLSKVNSSHALYRLKFFQKGIAAENDDWLHLGLKNKKDELARANLTEESSLGVWRLLDGLLVLRMDSSIEGASAAGDIYRIAQPGMTSPWHHIPIQNATASLNSVAVNSTSSGWVEGDEGYWMENIFGTGLFAISFIPTYVEMMARIEKIPGKVTRVALEGAELVFYDGAQEICRKNQLIPRV